jgi:hypothetical protein
MVANSLNCLQGKQHGIELHAYLAQHRSFNLHDFLAHLIIVSNWDVEGEAALPKLAIIHDLTCVFEDAHPKQP